MFQGVVKYYGWTLDYVLWDISFINLIMLIASIESDEDKGEEITLGELAARASNDK